MNSERFSQEINTLVSVDTTRTTAQISEQNTENDAQDVGRTELERLKGLGGDLAHYYEIPRA